MRLLVLGDTHGNLTEIQWAFAAAHRFDAELILQLGDFGFWPRTTFGQRFLKETSKLASSSDIPVYWIDGNHEDFHMLYNGFDVSRPPVRVRREVYWLPRGLAWTWEGVKFLAMGGGASIDRRHRTLGKTWFLEELISDADVDKAVDTDILVTHDAPYNVAVANGRRLIVDEDSDHCQKQIRRVLNVSKPDLQLHGHWHIHSDVDWMREGGYTRVVGLSHDNSLENMGLLDLDNGKWEFRLLTASEKYGRDLDR